MAKLPPPQRPIHADRAVWACRIVSGGEQFGVRALSRLIAEAGNAMGYRITVRQPRAQQSMGQAYDILFDRAPAPDASSAGVPGRRPYPPNGAYDLLLSLDTDALAQPGQVKPLIDPLRTAGVSNLPIEPHHCRAALQRGV